MRENALAGYILCNLLRDGERAADQ